MIPENYILEGGRKEGREGRERGKGGKEGRREGRERGKGGKGSREGGKEGRRKRREGGKGGKGEGGRFCAFYETHKNSLHFTRHTL